MSFYAHSDKIKAKLEWHLLKDHLHDTATTAARFAKFFDADKLAYVAGLLHDIGKYSPEFQSRLCGNNIKVDHSTAGAIEAIKRYGTLGVLLAYVIAGHHCGLPDWGSEADEAALAGRLLKKLKDCSAFSSEIELLLPRKLTLPALKPMVGGGFSVQFLIRFLYSCQVDADFLDTERALNVKKAAHRQPLYSLESLAKTLDRFIDDKCVNAADTPINRKRAKILAECREKALDKQGLFTLTVPTGGGKTLSSLSFALRHAVEHKMSRVIYVIPYTSIIEQNAAVFKEVLGNENVLEHHSNFTYPRESQDEADTEFADQGEQKLRLATENWDMPVIAATNVQFFESLFAARSSRCRKLHNVANSVVILDEAQMLPTGFLKPCLNAVAELVTNYNVSVVLCTATQPAIKKLLPEAINPVEITSDPAGLYDYFKRVRVQKIGTVSDADLAEKLTAHQQVLCIVNSKKHARVLYEKIFGEGTFHLSTRMCPAHRTETLKEIKSRLKNRLVCRVVSTQLIEAGVDIDFPAVYRSMAGIDSIAQAAGRCNREGLLQEGQVYVFWPEDHGMPRGWLKRTASLGGMVLEGKDEPLGLESVKEYFSLLYEIDDAELDKERILAEIREQEKQLRFPFRTVAEKFKLIDDNTNTVVIPWDDTCKKALAEAACCRFPGSYSRELQRYGVEVYAKEFNELLEYGTLQPVGDKFFVLKEDVFKKHYSEKTGLQPITDSMFLNDTLII
ncbi:MAG: CRISPR-associated helicase Cas3' [Firmicutes bacterium]|nr:CRISPR-associated helicase Cas3' [Bacillota bacterium]